MTAGRFDRPTRRQLIAGVGLAVGASAFGSSEAVAAAGSPGSDLRLLQGLVKAEWLLVFSCRHILASSLLSTDSRKVVGLVSGQEHEHVAALREQIRHRGGSVPAPDRTAEAGLLPLFKNAPAEVDLIRTLVDVESYAQYQYFQAIGLLRDPALGHLAAEIMASEAQHWSYLADLDNHGLAFNAVPGPYVRGSPNLPSG